MASIGTIAAGAVKTAIITTATTSAINASMNVDGGFFKQLKDVGKIAWDDTTSRQSFENYAITAATAALTTGTTQYLDGVTHGAVTAGNSLNATIPQQITSALSQSAISNTVSTATQSAINGDSFTDALENQLENIAISAVANLGATQIARAARGYQIKNPDGSISISKPTVGRSTQLTLHSVLGCGSSMAGGGDCVSGAVSGLAGQLAGEKFDNMGLDKRTGSKLAGLVGGLSSIATGSIAGLEDHEIAQNIYSGQRIASNAAVNDVYNKIFPHGIPDHNTANAVRKAIREAALTGDTNTLKMRIKDISHITPSDKDLGAITLLHEKRDFVMLRDYFGNDDDYFAFNDKYTMQVGLFFDGTDNDRNRDYNIDPTQDRSTNVARMDKIYGADNKNSIHRYITGVGTSGGLDTICLTTGCGYELKQQDARNFLIDEVLNSEVAKSSIFLPIDTVSFSRGVTTASDFINQINNESYWTVGLMPRSHMMFDPVASYGVPGNGINSGLDLSTPQNVIAIQINAKYENRNLFDLQQLYSSTGQNPSPNHWFEIELPGVHSGIGGGYEEGSQGKTQDMAFYSMNSMIDKAKEFGIKFGDIPVNQQPSKEFNQLMNYYNQAHENLVANPNDQSNQSKFNAIEGLIKDISVHNSSWNAEEFWKIYNYSIGNERGVFYPNDKYLNELNKLNNNQQ